MTAERVLTLDDVELAVETFVSPTDPTVLPIAGGGQLMVWCRAAGRAERTAGCGPDRGYDR